MRLFKSSGQNTNFYFYDPRRTNNGGGYFQPAGVCWWEVNGVIVKFSIDDDQCGDFGTRFYVSVETDGFKIMFTHREVEDDIRWVHKEIARAAKVLRTTQNTIAALISLSYDEINNLAWEEQERKEVEA